jgi:hypothetical protein
MSTTKEWTVAVLLSEDGDVTRAEAVLHTGVREELRGHGAARRNPADPLVPEIGDELATARALSDLAHKLLDVAARDIEDVEHRQRRHSG